MPLFVLPQLFRYLVVFSRTEWNGMNRVLWDNLGETDSDSTVGENVISAFELV